jgi:hypothetical protein
VPQCARVLSGAKGSGDTGPAATAAAVSWGERGTMDHAASGGLAAALMPSWRAVFPFCWVVRPGGVRVAATAAKKRIPARTRLRGISITHSTRHSGQTLTVFR